jgi:hypothetical protein
MYAPRSSSLAVYCPGDVTSGTGGTGSRLPLPPSPTVTAVPPSHRNISISHDGWRSMMCTAGECAARSVSAAMRLELGGNDG